MCQSQLAHLLKNNTCLPCFIRFFSKVSNGATLIKALFKQQRTIIAAAAAKSLQLCPTLCDPIDGSPPGSPVPGILQARTLEWVAISSNA